MGLIIGWKSGALVKYQAGHVMKNPWFLHMRKPKTQTSLRIRAVWSSSLLIDAQTEQYISEIPSL